MAHISIQDTTPRASFSVGGTPTTGPFNFSFEFFDVTDLKVYIGGTLASYNAAPTTTTEYSVTGTAVDGGYEGGFITIGAAISNTTVVIVRDIPVARTTDFPYPSATLDIKGLNTDLDKQIAIQQQLESRLGRSLRQPDADVTDLTTLPDAATRASKFMAFDGTGQAVVAAGTSANLTPVSGFINTLLDDADAATARGTLSAAPRDPQYLALATNSELTAERVLTPGNGLQGSDGGAGGAYTLSIDPSMLRGYIAGLTLSNNGTDANNDIDISAGVAVDDGNAVFMKLTSSITKRLDAGWAVGTNQGGLDTGAEATSTWYHLWLIRRPDTGVVDVLFSTSATSPTMPTNYSQKRRIGAVRNDGSSNLLAFSQNDDWFLLGVPIQDFTVSSPGTSAVLRTLTVPTGIKVLADISLHAFNSAGATEYFLHTSPDQADTTPAATVFDMRSIGAALAFGLNRTLIRTNTSAQIRTRATVGGANTTMIGNTFGWLDSRGRFA